MLLIGKHENKIRFVNIRNKTRTFVLFQLKILYKFVYFPRSIIPAKFDTAI